MKVTCSSKTQVDRYARRALDAHNMYREKDIHEMFDGVDLDDADEVVSRCMKLLTIDKNACFVLAGIVAKVFSTYNIPYECCVDCAVSREHFDTHPQDLDPDNVNRMYESGFCTHCYTRNLENNKIYEYFPGIPSKEIVHPHPAAKFYFILL